MDDTFNEGYVKAFLMGLLSPYAPRGGGKL